MPTAPRAPDPTSSRQSTSLAAGQTRIALQGSDVAYQLRRSRRKTIGLRIDDTGLRVAAPTWVSQAEIERVLHERSPWIIRHLQGWQARQARLCVQRTRWEDGGHLPYLGTDIHFRLSGSGVTHYAGELDAPLPEDVLWLGLPEDAGAERIRDGVHAWLQQRAQVVIGERLALALSRTGLTIQGWRLSSAATRWGSCNSRGQIRLSWRLVHFGHAIIDYVIIHELAHLREMNHGPRFWAEVEHFMPEYREARDVLRRVDPGALPLF